MPAELQALKQEAERRLAEWADDRARPGRPRRCTTRAPGFRPASATTTVTTRRSPSFPAGYNCDLWHACLNVDTAQYFDDVSTRLAPDAESMIVLANPVLPHSEGEIVLESADPSVHPAIRMNYFGDAHDMKVMVAVLRRALDIVAHWPSHRAIGPLMVPPFLAREARPPGGRDPERRAAGGSRAALLAHRVPPDVHLPDRQRRRSATARSWASESCAWRMRASCPTWSAGTRTRRRS